MTASLMPDWHEAAACAGTPLELWFPVNGIPTTEALAACRLCPVRDACLQDALRSERDAGLRYRHGIRGGWTPAQRAEVVWLRP